MVFLCINIQTGKTTEYLFSTIKHLRFILSRSDKTAQIFAGFLVLSIHLYDRFNLTSLDFMTKSIFNYDSSDDEKSSNHAVYSNTTTTSSDFLYRVGNAVLHHQDVFKGYRGRKTDYTTKQDSWKIVNKFLTRKTYTNDDKIDSVSLASFLSNTQPAGSNEKFKKLLVKSRELYKKVEEAAKQFQKEGAIINTTSYIDALYSLTDDLITKTFDIDLTKIKEFKKEITNLQDLKANIDSLKSLTDNLPLMKSIIQEAISQQREPVYPSLVTIKNLCDEFSNDVSDLTEYQKIYKYLDDLEYSDKYH